MASATKLKPVATLPEKPKRKTIPAVKLTAKEQRTIGQVLAAIAGGFLPIASFVLAHVEVQEQPFKWILLAAALLFSAPTLAEWAQKWCHGVYKAWGFTVLLEGVMVFSSSQYLALAGLAILVAINCNSAWHLAGKK